MTRPYFEKDGVSIWHGDCREIMPNLGWDVVVTDPPYGVTLGSTSGTGGRSGLKLDAYASFSDTPEAWRALVPPVLRAALGRATRGAVFAGPHLQDYPPSAALGGIYCAAGAGRHAWGFKVFLPILFYGAAPDLSAGLGSANPIVLPSSEQAEPSTHPVPKPIGWMRWLVRITTRERDVVFDPFMGSGTTLVAARDLGLRAVGIEVEERYCELAARRLDQNLLPFEPEGIRA